jgi:hypothetical protein
MLYHAPLLFEDEPSPRKRLTLPAMIKVLLNNPVGVNSKLESNRGYLTVGGAVRLFGDNRCADVRDKIFGLQALVMPQRRIVVDYSMKADDLFAEVMSKYLTEEFLLEVAIHCDDNQHRSSVDPVDLAAVAAIAKPLLGISRGMELAARIRAVRAKYQVHELFHTFRSGF